MKKFSFVLAILVASVTLFAQEDQGSTMDQPTRPPLEFPWEQVNTGEFADPVPYQPIRQADVMYYITIWRIIDLREKLNHPLYFPAEKRGTWRSLAQLIFDAIDFENIDNPNALTVYTDEYCNVPADRESVMSTLVRTELVPEIDIETGDIIGMKPISDPFRSDQVFLYRVKELWYFDKQRSALDVRILEIEPMLEFVKENPDQPMEEEGDEFVQAAPTKKRIGYIKYDELRPYLVKQEMFNVKNNAQRLSLDDVLTFKRQFISFIYAEENVYARDIGDYIANPRDQRLESERISNEIRMFEHDLWDF